MPQKDTLDDVAYTCVLVSYQVSSSLTSVSIFSVCSYSIVSISMEGTDPVVPTKEGPLSYVQYVLYESPYASVVIVIRGHPSLISLDMYLKLIGPKKKLSTTMFVKQTRILKYTYSSWAILYRLRMVPSCQFSLFSELIPTGFDTDSIGSRAL